MHTTNVAIFREFCDQKYEIVISDSTVSDQKSIIDILLFYDEQLKPNVSYQKVCIHTGMGKVKYIKHRT